jgi:hypothetical protein
VRDPVRLAGHDLGDAAPARPATQKKSLGAAEQDRPDVAAERRRWRVRQRYMDPARFVFLDETGASTDMVRRYGWGPRGERLVDAAPHGHWRTTAFVAGLRSTGLVAPLVLDGPMTGEVFRAYVRRVLAPALERGDGVGMDNLPAHKAAGVREAIEAAGASVMPLPAYSPDLARPEPDRAGLRQAEGRAAQGRRPDARRPLGRHRAPARRLRPRRMPQLHRQLRLCVRLTRKRSSRLRKITIGAP